MSGRHQVFDAKFAEKEAVCSYLLPPPFAHDAVEALDDGRDRLRAVELCSDRAPSPRPFSASDTPSGLDTLLLALV